MSGHTGLPVNPTATPEGAQGIGSGGETLVDVYGREIWSNSPSVQSPENPVVDATGSQGGQS